MPEKISWDRFSSVVFFACAIFCILQAGLILAVFSKLPPEIPLFYSREWGSSILTKPFFLWIMPAIVLVCLAVNFLTMTKNLESKFLVRVLVTFSLVVAVMCSYNTVKIISLLI